MTRWFAWLPLLLLPTALSAQDAAAAKKAFIEADQEKAWIEQFDGATLKDWQASGGVLIKDGHMVLGGPGTTLLKLKSPLGKKFKILIECRNDAPASPNLVLETRQLLGRGASAGSISLVPGQWCELLLVGDTDERGQVSLFQHALTVPDRKVVDSTGPFGGQGVPTVSLEVPPGGKLTIRRIRLETLPPADNPAGLFIALGVLTLVIIIVVCLGWWLQRRKHVASPTPPASGGTP